MNKEEIRETSKEVRQVVCDVLCGTYSPEESKSHLMLALMDLDMMIGALDEPRKLRYEDLRQLCIENNWYTKGTNEEYERLLTTTSNLSNIATSTLVTIATDIKQHSDTTYCTAEICTKISDICKTMKTDVNYE